MTIDTYTLETETDGPFALCLVPAFPNFPGSGQAFIFQKQLVDLAKTLGASNIAGGIIVLVGFTAASLSPPGTFQLYHTVSDIPPKLFREVCVLNPCSSPPPHPNKILPHHSQSYGRATLALGWISMT